MEQKIWFITGISSGFGKLLAEEVVKSGNIAVGTVRKLEQKKSLQTALGKNGDVYILDVTHEKQIPKVIEKVIKKFGRIDVLVNNAGYGLVGAVEEISSDELRAVLDTNVMGAFNVTRAVLPFMRAQKSGRIFQLSSIAGMRANAGFGGYNASKFALEGFSEALSQEVKHLNIFVTIVEPGPFRTEFAGGSIHIAKNVIEDYAQHGGNMRAYIDTANGNQVGDPLKAVKLIMRVAEHENPPLRLPMGALAVNGIRVKLQSVLDNVTLWEAESVATNFDA